MVWIIIKGCANSTGCLSIKVRMRLVNKYRTVVWVELDDQNIFVTIVKGVWKIKWNEVIKEKGI